MWARVFGLYLWVHFETDQAADTQTQEYCLSNPTLSGCVLVAGSYRFAADARSPRGVSRKGNGSHLWSFEEWIWVFLGSGSCHHLFLPNFLPCRCCFGLFNVPSWHPALLWAVQQIGVVENITGQASILTPQVLFVFVVDFQSVCKKGPMGKLCWDGNKAPKCCFHSCGTGGVHEI